MSINNLTKSSLKMVLNGIGKKQICSRVKLAVQFYCDFFLNFAFSSKLLKIICSARISRGSSNNLYPAKHSDLSQYEEKCLNFGTDPRDRDRVPIFTYGC